MKKLLLDIDPDLTPVELEIDVDVRSPHRQLLSAILYRAVADLSSGCRLERAEATWWFYDDRIGQGEIGFTFPEVAEHLGLEPSCLVKKLEDQGLLSKPPAVIMRRRARDA